jgi:hypothetical protein
MEGDSKIPSWTEFQCRTLYYPKNYGFAIAVLDDRIYVPIGPVAYKIWTDPKYANTVATKSLNAANREELPKESNCAFVPFEWTLEYLRKYCRKDTKAQEELDAFDMDTFERDIKDTVCSAYQRQIDSLKNTIQNTKRKIENISRCGIEQSKKKKKTNSKKIQKIIIRMRSFTLNKIQKIIIRMRSFTLNKKNL